MTSLLHWIDLHIQELAELGGKGSGNFKHKGRPGQEGGSTKSKGKVGHLKRPSAKQVNIALEIGLSQWIPGAHVDPSDVDWELMEVSTTQISATESKKPDKTLIEAYSKGAQIQPLSLLAHDRSRYTVLDGNHRLKAARLAGVSFVWAVVIRDLKR